MGKTKKHKTFFEQDTPHGIVKRVMYKKYLQAYIPMTQSLKTFIIDGFAGAGRYSSEWPSEIEKYGSPLIALMVVLEYGLTFKTINEEKEKKKRQKGANTDRMTEQSRQDNVVHMVQKEKIKQSPGEVASTSSGQTTDMAQNTFGWESTGKSPEEELREIEKRRRTRNVFWKTRLSMLFIEKDSGNYKNLVCNVELLLLKFFSKYFPEHQYTFQENENGVQFSVDTDPYSFSVALFNQSFESFDPTDILKDDVRSLTFVDPFGYKNTPMHHLRKFAPGEGNEIFMNFMSRDVNRFAKVNPEHVFELYGLKVAKDYCIEALDMKILHSHPGDKEEKEQTKNNIRKCTESFEWYLKRNTESLYSLVFEVRGQGNCIIFHMVYITNHIRGVEVMKSSMSKCSQKEGELMMSDYDIVRKGEKLVFIKREKAGVVADIIFKKFKGKANVEVHPTSFEIHRKGRCDSQSGYTKKIYDDSPSIREFVLLETNYRLWKTPLAILQRQGKITEVTENGEKQRRKNRFPDKDSETKKPIRTLVSFADDVSESEMHKQSSKDRKEKKKTKTDVKLKQKQEKRKKQEDHREEVRQGKENEKLKRKRDKEEERRQKEEETLRAKQRKYSNKPINEYFSSPFNNINKENNSSRKRKPPVRRKESKQLTLYDFGVSVKRQLQPLSANINKETYSENEDIKMS